MPHIRILRHYLHTPYIVMGAIDILLIIASVHGAYWMHMGPDIPGLVSISAVIYGVLGLIGMISMGVYQAQSSEGFTGMLLRTAVGLFIVANLLAAGLFLIAPPIEFGRGVLFFTTVFSFLTVAVFRWIAFRFVASDSLKRRVMVLGTGRFARQIATRMRRASDQRGFIIVAFARLNGSDDLVSDEGARVIVCNDSIANVCRDEGVQEVVVALDERRRNREGGGGLPVEELFECRLLGINVTEVQAFIERETGKLDIDVLQPSWMVFNDGFVTSPLRRGTKRFFDILASFGLLAVTWPFMVLAALAIRLDSRGPILYYQRRVGLNGEDFMVTKFRTMRTDAEADGQAVWARENDTRITRVGNLLRRTRIDELPQLLAVFKGDMSFVGPRPERPEFVSDLNDKIPYYGHRHYVKPGITGWAQLCYPYGASVEDAKHKLEYDLYYLKNHSILLDLIILIQTVEVVLIGEGAR